MSFDDSYLKANGIKDGLTNYDKILIMFKAWKKKPFEFEVKTKLGNWRPLSHYNWSILNRSSFHHFICDILWKTHLTAFSPKGDANIFVLSFATTCVELKGGLR